MGGIVETAENLISGRNPEAEAAERAALIGADAQRQAMIERQEGITEADRIAQAAEIQEAGQAGAAFDEAGNLLGDYDDTRAFDQATEMALMTPEQQIQQEIDYTESPLQKLRREKSERKIMADASMMGTRLTPGMLQALSNERVGLELQDLQQRRDSRFNRLGAISDRNINARMGRVGLAERRGMADIGRTRTYGLTRGNYQMGLGDAASVGTLGIAGQQQTGILSAAEARAKQRASEMQLAGQVAGFAMSPSPTPGAK